MNNVDIYMIAGNVLILLAAGPNMLQTYKHRDRLKGYSVLGCTLSALGVVFFFFAFMGMGNTIAGLLQIPAFAYYIILAYYQKKNIEIKYESIIDLEAE